MSHNEDAVEEERRGLQEQMGQTEDMSESQVEESENETRRCLYLQFSHDVSTLDPDGPKGQPRVIANFSRLQAAPYGLLAADAAVTTLYMYNPEALDLFLSRSKRHVKWECRDNRNGTSLLIIRNLG